MQVRFCALLMMFALTLTGLANAQERFGTLTGKVTDQQGIAVPGATVTITNATTVRPGPRSAYASRALLRAGFESGERYTISFELQGFSKVEQPDVTVTLGRTFNVDAVLRVGQLTETVTVTGEASPLVDTRSTLIAHNVSAEEFDRLPKTRSFQSIALTAPSVNMGEVEGGFQINGASGAENSFTVDGTVTPAGRRPLTAEHGVRVSPGSPGQDQRHLGRVRRRAWRRDQRRDQERRQCVPRRGALSLRGQRARGAPRAAAGPRPGDRGDRLLRAGRGTAAQRQRVRRLARWSIRSRPAVLLRRLVAAP